MTDTPIEELLTAYHDGELSDAERKRVESALSESAELRAHLGNRVAIRDPGQQAIKINASGFKNIFLGYFAVACKVRK